MRDKDREAEQDYWDIHPEEEKEHIEKAKAEGEPMLIINEKVVWVNKDYSKLKNVKGGDWLFILTWIGKLLYGDKYDELMKKTNKTRRRR